MLIFERRSSMKVYEIRAHYTHESIVMYQAYSPEIAEPALREQQFVSPFSFNRMTWIKPSFLWMMERSNWGQKKGQEHILAIRIRRDGWEKALSSGVLTSYDAEVYKDRKDWQTQFDQALVYIQWDPERSLQGKSLESKSIQVGLSRSIIEEYTTSWIQEIQDYTPLVRKMHHLLQSGHRDKAIELMPKERPYPVNEPLARRLGMKY
jgi:hypothetical protein